ncbi:MAG: S8 family serine peptidase, partial [Desulfobacterales bacterium]|nr:S8 family serine peptidase [Deltaproteobacteria bacterium]NNL42528.1 S8 family serine peptidase [Desulfobacterales bacterium]
MKKLFIVSLTIILFFSTLLSADSISTMDVGNLIQKADYVPGELLVKYKTQFREATSSFYKTNWNISTIRTFKSIGCQQVKLPQGMTVEQALDMYRNDPDVEYAEPNYIYHATLTPNDTSFGELWGLHNTGQPVNGTSGTSDADIDATEAWDVATGGSVIIAVIDSGVKYDHEDLVGNIWINSMENTGTGGVDDDSNGYVDDIRGWDFVDNDNDPMDYNNHGTHVAGTIAAVGDNSLGVTGVCWTAQIMPIRALNAAGSGMASDLLAAIQYANDNGADIINNSWGGGPYSAALETAISGSSALVVCAAGNSDVDNDSSPHYPSSYNSANIISVAATDQNDNRASFSNYGATSVDVGAPGVNIYSTITTRHDVFSDNFSSGLGNWISGGINNTWAISSGYLDESPGADYVINTDSWIRTTSAISLAGEIGIKLEFLLQGISETGWDFLYIQTSPDGSTWTTQAQLSGSTGGQWFPMEYDINSLAGGNVYIRFRFTSDGSINSDGWHIDNVRITAYTPGAHDNYDHFQGTSMATPVVSGIAGLLKASNPALTNIQIKSLIEDNVDTLGSLSGVVATGGRVNVNNIFPAVPLDLTAAVFSATRIDLDWTDNSSNEDGFIIERKIGAGGTWGQIATVGANTTSYN